MSKAMPKYSLLAFLPLVLPFASPGLAADSTPPGAAAASVAAPAAVPPGSPSVDDAHKQLADAKDELATALRSYSLLQDENNQLKDAAEKNAGDKAVLAAKFDNAQDTIASLKVAAAAAVQVDTLRTQVRQLQDQVAAMSAENERLKLRLALAGRPPGGGMPVPTRPDQQ
jgi:hypothetical protein